VPAIDRDLAGDQCGTTPVALLDDLEQVAALLGPERLQNGDTVIEANTDYALAGAEMRIVIDPLLTLQAGDFLL
jgi:hypothetical protein